MFRQVGQILQRAGAKVTRIVVSTRKQLNNHRDCYVHKQTVQQSQADSATITRSQRIICQYRLRPDILPNPGTCAPLLSKSNVVFLSNFNTQDNNGTDSISLTPGFKHCTATTKYILHPHCPCSVFVCVFLRVGGVGG